MKFKNDLDYKMFFPTLKHCSTVPWGLVLFNTKAHKQASWAELEFSIELRKYFANNN